MRIDILTLFPEMFAPLEHSIIKRATDSGILDLHITNIRDYTNDRHHTADDKLYGGGAGMVMKPEPIFDAVADCKQTAKNVRVVLTSPRGALFTQRKAEELSQADQVIFICGHYEGVDQRVEDALVTDVLSIGDFVLTGGEVPAMVMADAVARLVPGVLGDEASFVEESFSGDLLEYPQYTRPSEYAGQSVPQVLTGGNHEEIRKWRRRKSLEATLERRPDLLEKAALTQEDIGILKEVQQEKEKPFRLFVSLVHYPVYNKKKHIINTSLTNLDLHDIARASTTFGVEKYYLVQPQEAQIQLIETLLAHWREGFGATYNPDRHNALDRVEIMKTLEDAEAAITAQYGEKPKIICTTANVQDDMMPYQEMRETMRDVGGNYLLVFGTGWGLTDELLARADYVLRPIYGAGEYNHLSVRSAVSIILDRLMGESNARKNRENNG